MTAAVIYDLGDTLGASVTFNVAGVPTDPDTVTFSMRSPVTGTVTTYVYLTDGEVQQLATGVYEATIVVSEPGRWWYRWLGTGAAPGNEQGYFEVDYNRVSG
jgi:hypothetical protein